MKFYEFFRIKNNARAEPQTKGVSTEKDIFYLNDFYDLLYENASSETQRGLEPPEYFEAQKYYTMGPGIDFPLIMNYFDTEIANWKPYFYFLNGHNDVIYFSDQNFTEGETETYEYNPWGVLLTQANKNNLLYTSRELDFDTGLQFNTGRYYSRIIGRFTSKNLSIFENNFIFNFNNPLNFFDNTEYVLKSSASGIYIICALKFVFCPDAISNSCYRDCKAPCKDTCKQDSASYGMSGFFAFPCIWPCECFCLLGCASGCGCMAF